MRAIPTPSHRVVPDPDTGKTIPAEGAPVRLSGYWQRCADRGWVRLEEDAPAPAPAAPERPRRKRG